MPAQKVLVLDCDCVVYPPSYLWHEFGIMPGSETVAAVSVENRNSISLFALININGQMEAFEVHRARKV